MSLRLIGKLKLDARPPRPFPTRRGAPQVEGLPWPLSLFLTSPQSGKMGAKFGFDPRESVAFFSLWHPGAELRRLCAGLHAALSGLSNPAMRTGIEG